MATFLEHVQACDTIITHDSCADGTASALLLSDALPRAQVKFVQYGTQTYNDLRPEPGRKYLFCDMSPPKWRAQEFADAGSVVLDHHASAKSVVQQFGPLGVFADEKDDPGVSGALLAYTRVWLPMRGAQTDTAAFAWINRFAKLSGIYDTWQKNDPEWKEAVELVRTMHFQENVEWLRLGLLAMAAQWESKYQWLGPILVQKADKSTRRTADSVIKYKTKAGTKVGLVNNRGINDLTTLVPNADLLVGFGYEIQAGKLKLICSLRSREYDCASLAKTVGGGGHRSAAGMSIDADEFGASPYSTLVALIERYEEGSR